LPIQICVAGVLAIVAIDIDFDAVVVHQRRAVLNVDQDVEIVCVHNPCQVAEFDWP